jgi:hypothetical protein
VRSYPAQQAAALFASNTFDQALVIWPRYAPIRRNSPSAMGDAHAQAVDDTRSRRSAPRSNAARGGYAIGVAGLVDCLVLRDATARRVGIVVLAGLALNAAIFGGLSAPVPRYQARVAWLALDRFRTLLARLIAQRGADSGDLR